MASLQDPMDPLSSSQPSGPSSTPSLPGGSDTATPPGAIPGNRTDAQNQLAQIAAAQTQADQAQQAGQQATPDTSHGWSWTNPFQDVGQVWHDVETHTVSPVFHAAHWAYFNLIARPYSTLALYDAEDNYKNSTGKPNWSWFQGSQWEKSWNASADISPGQATVLALNNDPIEARYGQGFNPAETVLGPGNRYFDPENPQQLQQLIQASHDNWGLKIASGSADALIGWYADPTSHLTKGTKLLKDVKDVPLNRADNVATATKKLASPKSAKFDQWAVGKPIGVIAEHPLVKGTFNRANPYQYQMAALIAGAKTPEEVNLIRKIAYNIDPVLEGGLIAQTGDISPAAKALDKLSQTAPDTAVQVSNLLLPQEFTDKWALSSASDDEKDQWLQKASQAKANAAQESINIDPEAAQNLLKLRGSGLTNTATNDLANRLAQIRGTGKYLNTRNVDGVSLFRRAYYNYPIRVYQGLVDRPPGLINHNEDDAITSARSWLNKSSVLTPDDKTEYLQRYASATPAQRQHTWRSIENDVYDKVADAHGIPQDTMKRILTTTRSKQQNCIQGARSKAYGGIKIGDETHAVLPSADDEVILHPMFLAQLERGAMPQANLRDLENALEAMNRNGTLAPIFNGGLRAADTLTTLLDKVYGVWKPASLMTGHRAFNHIGDDFLRGVSKIGALATINNATDGAYNFLRNTKNRLTRNAIVNNVTFQHETAINEAKAQYEGLVARAVREKELKVPAAWRTDPKDIAAAKDSYTSLRDMELDFVQPKYRLGEGTFKIAGSNLSYSEMFGGPNADYMRWVTSSHPTWNSTVDGTAHSLHSQGTAIRSSNFGTISPTEDVVKHTRAYVHFVRNQIMADPVGRMVVKGRDLDETGRWLSNTAEGRAHMKALHIGDPDSHVQSVAEIVKTMLPTDELRDAAGAGKFNSKAIEKAMPNAGSRPEVPGAIGQTLFGGDSITEWLKNSTNNIMKWTGTLPDDIMVRHPFVNAMYKNRMTDAVQRHLSIRGAEPTLAEIQQMSEGAMRGARKDMQNTLYDVSRFNDMGHTLRFISPFFNAWWNAMSSWSKLFLENPSLLGRTYQAKRALWNSPFSVNTDTGQKADVNTPWDKTAFVIHMPKALSNSLGGLTSIPIDAKTLISPTYIDSVGNPGFGPIVAIPVNQIVKDHPSLMNDTIVRSMLNNMVDKNSMSQLLPSGMRDMQTISQILVGSPDSSQQYANTVWSIYQEQQYDYLNGARSAPPNWSDVENQAKYLTVLDLVANRLMPLGFKPAAAHANLIEEYHAMLDKDPKNARQDFYNKYGPAGMVFTQSLSTDPTGIPATVGADKLVNKYASIIAQYPELGSVIVGPNGSGAYDQMAYDWQVAKGLRKQLSPQDAANQVAINTGWAQYGQIHAVAMAQLQSRQLSSLNAPGAKDIKAQITNFVSKLGDKNDPQYNPSWYANYTSFNQNAYQDRLSNLLQIAQDPQLLGNSSRSDIKSLAAYAQKRDEAYAQLQKRSNKSITAAGNQDIARTLDIWIGQRMLSDTKFGALYERYLSKDDFKEPS